MKRCSHCRTAKPIEEFCMNRRRKDGMNGDCRDCQSLMHKNFRAKDPSAANAAARRRSAAWESRGGRDKEKTRAKWAIHTQVKRGLRPRASSLKCFDCGGQARWYDHHLGYSREHRYDVQPTCPKCDGLRQRKRKEKTGRKR